MKCFYNPPLIIKKFFSGFCWTTVNNRVLLTFDDGPIPETTPLILDELDRFNIKSLFFCIGNNIRKNPELAAEILRRGHLIGNHTFNHKRITCLGHDEFIKEVRSVNELLLKELNYKAEYFRPPHGRFSFTTGKNLKQEGLKNIMWSLLTFDYKNNLNIVKFAVREYLRADSIIVLHDSLKSKDIIIESISTIYEEAGRKGCQFGEPRECLK
ncbi:MAG: polysaccharide deacetylase family protein [Ignavibacteria bacterium]